MKIKKIMKLNKYIVLSVLGLASLTSCNDWLDINVNPDTPTDASATIETRLAWCQFYTNSAYQFAGMRTNMACGDMTMNSMTSTYGGMSVWSPVEGMVTTPYQWFFVGAGSNLNDLYDKAMAQGAWHYAAASRMIKAYGFMLMTDLYGEMPYTEALGANALPAYDNGKTIFLGCLKDIDEAIELFKKTQEPSVPALAGHDSWNNGDVNKWLKMCYLLKARWINHLIKKGEGTYTDGKYDSNEILACLENAMKSNDDNTIVNHNDNNGPTHDVLGWDEPVDYSPLYSVLGMNNNYYVTKTYTDNLTNFGGYGVEDPRADKLIPWAVSTKTASTPEGIKYSGDWRRSVGVDMQSTIHVQSGPYTLSFNASKGGWYCDNEKRKGDTIYVNMISGSKGYAANKDLLNRKVTTDDRSARSGGFYIRPSSPTYVATYHEACFIKAEVLFRKGDKTGAFTAYKEGIKASMELMNQKLNTWCGEDETLKKCPSFTPMAQADMDNFLNNGIGTAGDLTLGKILTQKRIAMMFSVEVWNDMRRYDYNPEIFLNWNIPMEYHTNQPSLQKIPEGKTFRRWQQCSHEYKYNAANLAAIGTQVPGATTSGTTMWALAKDIWTIPVWWDSDQQ